MKRDPRLVRLSHEHHLALVLARRARVAGDEQGDADAARAEISEHFRTAIGGHFADEEAILLPALDAVGATLMAERVRNEHAELMGLHTALTDGGNEALLAFGTALHDHVRFEERELFPACERLLSNAALDAIGAELAAATGA